MARSAFGRSRPSERANGIPMRHARKNALIAFALAIAGAAGAAAAADEWWGTRGGLGLKSPEETPAPSSYLAPGGDPAVGWPVRHPFDYALYGGLRELPRLGLRSTETVGGVFYPLSDAWKSSLEAGVAPESWLAPRRYSLSGQVRTALAGGRGISVGLQYRVYETGGALAGEPPGVIGSGYAPGIARTPGAALAPGYQLQLNYQYSPASSFGLALGRDVETYTPFSEVPGGGLRQFTFTGQYWLTPSWALSYDVLSGDPANLRVQGLRLGIRYRF